MAILQIKSKKYIDELIGKLSHLDSSALNYALESLQKLQNKKDQNIESEETAFWQLIDKIDWQKKSDDARLQPLIDALSANSSADIFRFSEQLALKLYNLDGPQFAEALEKDELGFSADTFLYTRCLVVAKGEGFYKNVIKNPNEMPLGKDFEALLYVAEKAYFQKNKKPYNYVPTTNYESFFNQKLWGSQAISL